MYESPATPSALANFCLKSTTCRIETRPKNFFRLSSKMSDANSDAKNTTLLFFLDQLAQGPRSLHDLSCQFGSPHFTNDMKLTVGNNKLGLKRFLLQFPSLFVIDGDDVRIAGADFVAAAGGTTTSGTSGRVASSTAATVIMPSIMKTPPPLCKLTPISSQNGSSKRQGSMSSDSSLCSPSRSEENATARRPPVQHNRSLNADDDAVQFFRRKLESFLLAHPNDEGMTLPSLLGHRSQALPHVRDVCGRNAKELIAFIRRHRDVFLIIPSNDGYGQEITLVQRPKPTTATTSITSNGDSAVNRQSSQPPLSELGLIEFLVNVLRDKGAYFIEQLYGHMNAKFTRDERNEFARNPRELKALIEKYCNVFVISENLVQLEPAAVQSITINGVQKFFANMPRPSFREHNDATSNGHNGADNGHRADDADSVSSRDSKTHTQRTPQITVQKTALEKAIRAAIESNEAHGYSCSPPQMAQDSHRRPTLTKQNSVVSQSSMPSNVPWTEVTKVRHMKQIVREIFEVCDKIALHVVLSDNSDDAESTTRRTADYVFLVSSHDTAVYGFNVSSSSGAAAGIACLRDGGLRELLSSDKVTKYSFDAAELGLALVQIFSDDYETLKIKNLSDIATAEAVSSYFSPAESGRREKLENCLLSSSSVTDVIEDECDLSINDDLAQLAEAYAVQKVEKNPSASLAGKLRREDRNFHAYREVKAYFPALSDAIHSTFNLRYLPLLQQMACGEQLERLREPALYALLKEQRDLHVQLDVIHDMMERRAAATNGHTFSSSSGEADDSAPFLARECAIMRRLGQLSSLISQARNERAVKMNLLREEQRRQAAVTTVDDSEQTSESCDGHAAKAENQGDSVALEGQSGGPVTTSDVACQTVITGDIIAKCLFIAGRAKAVDF